MKQHHIHTMEDETMTMKTNHKKKNKNLISHNVSDGGGGGDGIAGLVLVAVGFIAVVTLSFINKNRTKGSESNPKPKALKNQEDQEIETNQGLQALLQPLSSTTTTKDGDAAPCHATTDTKSDNHTFIQEKIDTVDDINTIGEVVSATSFQEEIVLSDDSNSESAASSHDSRIDDDCSASLEVERVDDDDDDVVSEIIEEKDCSLEAILTNSNDEGGTIDMQNEEPVEANTDTEVANDAVTVEDEITSDENGNLSMEVNAKDQPILVSNSFQLTTLLMLLPGLILLLVLLLFMHLTQKFSFLQ